MLNHFQKKRQISNLLSTIIIIIACLSVVYLCYFSNHMETDVEKSISPQTDQVSDNNQPSHTEENDLAKIIHDYRFDNGNKATIKKLIKNIINTNYHGEFLSAQSDLVTLFESSPYELKNISNYVLPDFPASWTHHGKNQINIPLYLQNDPQVANLSYGTDGSQSIAENGCAIVSLAMVDSYLSKKEVLPKDVLKWAKNDYYEESAGTSWRIFSDYAMAHDLTFYNYGNNFAQAMQALNEGQVVIASVSPGFFTEVGHIIVIRGYQNGFVYVNDPNDDIEKMHSLQAIPESTLIEEGINYWSFSN